jgi:hypothetical protein
LIYHVPVIFRAVLLAGAVLVLSSCATINPPIEQRTTHGPAARDLWTVRMLAQLGREPSFDEQRHFDNELELRIGEYLRAHPEDANALTVSTFRFDRQVAVGMSKEQVIILLGPPLALTTDQAEMEQRARKFWPALRGNVTEAWAYPLGWTVYFAGQRVVDITRYVEGGKTGAS